MAKIEAIIKFDVPVTLTFGNLYFPPFKPFLEEIFTYPFSKLFVAPKLLNPERCQLVSLTPNAQPPPNATLIFFLGYLAKSGPIVKTPALIVETKLYGTTNLWFFLLVIVIIFFDIEKLTLAPSETKRSFIVCTSFTNGTFLRVILFLNKIDAAIIGRQEFLAPLILTSPLIALLGPLIVNLFILF